MSRNQFLFYTTASDLGPLLSSLEAHIKLQYTLMGLFDKNRIQTYLSFVDIPDFGRANDPNASSNPCYLVSVQGTVLHMRDVPQKAGGVLFSINQNLNDDTIVFRPGGRYGNSLLLYGQAGTISDSITSKSLYDLMARLFRERFTLVREYLVGPEALALWKSGVRLTLSVSTPSEFDLKP